MSVCLRACVCVCVCVCVCAVLNQFTELIRYGAIWCHSATSDDNW